MENDILFIDSSHVIRIGNDVEYEYLEILPRLKKGVIVQIHDICLPAQYAEKWVMNNLSFWTEQYLLQAFLCFNDAFEVLWSGSHMHFNHPHELKTLFPKWENSFTMISGDNIYTVPSYDNKNVWPTSLWIRKKS